MSSDLSVCPRCDREVDTLQFVPPDILTKELIEAIDSGEEDTVGTEDNEICTECMDELERAIDQGV